MLFFDGLIEKLEELLIERKSLRV